MSPVTCTMICIPITQSSTPASAPTTFFSTLCTTLGSVSTAAASVSPTVTNPSTRSSTIKVATESSTQTTTSTTPSSNLTATSTKPTLSNVPASTSTTMISTTKKITTEVSSATTVSSSEKNPCQNGGIWDGEQCDCPNHYEGSFCEFLDDEIEIVEVEVTVDVTLRIINLRFSPELQDKESDVYKNFSQEFTDQMDTIYKKIHGYKNVTIINIRHGSIIVDHKVVLGMENEQAVSSEVINNKVKEIETTLKNSSGGSNGFIFDNSSTTVENPVLIDNCASLVPQKLIEYYKLLVTKNKVICASVCDSRRNNSMKCGNGMCGMTNNGPKCYCDVSPDYWYFGDYCDQMIHRTGLIAGVSVTLILLVLGLLALMIYLMKIHKTMKKPQMNIYNEV
ncbi:mucin-3A-like [Hemitrygon akajei]|uniref:mucin-3A-like n=1 Tax=Hemitrygon akajei TaxID=2704970 RepID=UPI003BFA06C7